MFSFKLFKLASTQKMKTYWENVIHPLTKEILESLSENLNVCKYCGYKGFEGSVRFHYRLRHKFEILDELKIKEKEPETPENTGKILYQS